MSATLSDPAVGTFDTISQVLAEIAAGDSQSLSAVGRMVGGKDPSSIFRYATAGVKLANGVRVKLAAVKVGSTWRTSRAAVERFIRAITPSSDPIPAQSTRTPTQARRESERAGRELAARGA